MPPGANSLAQIALTAWIPISIALFYYWRPAYAAGVCVIFAFLFLPELMTLSIPAMPPIDKGRLTSVCVLIGCWLRAPKGTLTEGRPRGAYAMLFWLGVLAPIGTVVMNTDDLYYGPTILPGLGLADFRIGALGQMLDVMLPFWLGHALFRTCDDLRPLLKMAFTLGLFYTVLALAERIKGPFLNTSLYGYGQHDFSQTVRAGGFRPMVFTSHGITLAKFFALCVLVGWCLSRQSVESRFIAKLKAGYVYAVLAVSNSLGALCYATVLGAAAMFSSVKVQLRAAQILTWALVIIPILRYANLFPVTEMVKQIEAENPDRASSLWFRFMNEDMLLEKFSSRPWFGWGGNARNRVITAAGEDISVTDGDWIIILGSAGVIGAIAYYGPPVLSVLKAAKATYKMSNRDDQLVMAALAMSIGMHLVDSIPNSLAGTPLSFLAGALAGTAAVQLRTPATRTAS